MDSLEIDCILAVDSRFGISKNGKIPWKIPEDMKFFRETLENYDNIVVGKNTFLSLSKKMQNELCPKLHIITTNIASTDIDTTRYISHVCFKDALKYICENGYYKVLVIGGSRLYNEAFKLLQLTTVYLTTVYGDYDTDNTVDKSFMFRAIGSEILMETDRFKIQKYDIVDNCEEIQYLDILKDLLKTSVRDTRNGKTYSDFGKRLEFDLTKSFPVLTTKKMYWKGIVEELLFFIRGNTDSDILSKKNVKIWEPNTTREFLDSRGLKYDVGDMGPMYGWNWRHFGAQYVDKYTDYTGKGFDQLKDVIEKLIKDPSSRRIVMTAFDPSKVSQAVLPPCHSMIVQFYVEDGKISEHMYQRSSDSFLGLPFNITQHALLLSLVGYVTGLKPNKLIISLGDTHIYEDHKDAVETQLERCTYSFPQLKILKELDNKDLTIEDRIRFLESLEFKDLKLENYISGDSIKASMIA